MQTSMVQPTDTAAKIVDILRGASSAAQPIHQNEVHSHLESIDNIYDKQYVEDVIKALIDLEKYNSAVRVRCHFGLGLVWLVWAEGYMNHIDINSFSVIYGVKHPIAQHKALGRVYINQAKGLNPSQFVVEIIPLPRGTQPIMHQQHTLPLLPQPQQQQLIPRSRSRSNRRDRSPMRNSKHRYHRPPSSSNDSVSSSSSSSRSSSSSSSPSPPRRRKSKRNSGFLSNLF